jgi:hypothetical protein
MRRVLFTLGAGPLAVGIWALAVGALYNDDDMIGAGLLILGLGVFSFAVAWFLT